MYNDLREIGLSEPILGMIDHSIWGGFLSIDEPIFVSYLLNFYPPFNLSRVVLTIISLRVSHFGWVGSISPLL